MSEYNLHIIRELLAEAFSSGEISTLAFDLFHEVYADFTTGMTRSQKIEMVVDTAVRRGMIPELLAYVQSHNLYQYNQFAGQLYAKTAADPVTGSGGKLSPSAQRRLQQDKEQLEGQWEIQAEKVKRLRNAVAVETNVAIKLQYEHQLAEAEKEMNATAEKLAAVEAQLE
jgi:hypothetical protein